MIKKGHSFIALLLVFFSSTGCRSKTYLPQQEYYAITPDGIQELQLKYDTIRLVACDTSLQCKGAAKYEYKIVDSKEINNDWLLYVETLRNLSFDFSSPEKYQMVALVRSIDKDKVGFIRENRFFKSLAECKDKGGFNPDSKFAISYYTPSFIKTLQTYKRVSEVDSSAFWKLKKSLVREVIRNKNLIRHTATGNTLMTDITRELMNRAMIQQKINPLISEDSLKSGLHNLNNNIPIR